MADVQTLFFLNDDGELEVNKPEARKIAEYAALLARDKGSPGDSEGRKKLIACAEIYYIYLVYDVRSIYYNLSLPEKQELARKDAGLPDTWKGEDELLKAAINRYLLDFKLTAAGKAYLVAERGYHTLASDAELLQETIVNHKYLLTKILAKVDKQSQGQPQEIELLGSLKEAKLLMEEIVNIQKNLLTNIEKFPKLGETVKTLASKFSEEG